MSDIYPFDTNSDLIYGNRKHINYYYSKIKIFSA